MQPVPERWMRKLGVIFLNTPARMEFAQPVWSMSPVSVVSTESAMLQDGPGARRNSRMTISASSDSFSIMSEALKSPTAIFISGYLCLNSMGGERRRAVICREGYFLTIPSRTLPPMKPVAPVLQTWLVNESAEWS